MSVEQRFDEIWLGGAEGQFYGCGFIVGQSHILTCNHVVRECLGLSQRGDVADDLVGRAVKGRTTDGDIDLKVVANRPLPAIGSGRNIDDDLCLLVRTDGALFEERAVARLLRQADCRVGDEEFSGQGLGQNAAATEYLPVPFRSKVFGKANFSYWYYTSADFPYLDGQPGCSGAAAVAQRHPGAVLGMMQGALKDQVGYLIPAWDFARFLGKAGVAAPWYDAAAPAASVRTSPFRSLRKPTALGIDERHLAFCNRDVQLGILNPALDTFLRRSDLSLLVAVSGDDDDLPGLFDQRFRRDGIDAYVNHLKYVLLRKVPKSLRENYPRIAVTLRSGDDCSTSEAIFTLISRSSAGGALGRLSPDPRAIAGALSEVDAPVLITVRGPAELMTPDALDLWRKCIAEIAERRANAPVIVLFLALQQPDAQASFAPQEGVVVLPELPLIARTEIQVWADNVLSTDAKLKWNAAKTSQVIARLRSDTFSLRQLQEWVADTAN